MEHCIVLSTHPDAEGAERLAETLVREELAACVNIVPGIRSIYEWRGELLRDAELLMVIKSRTDRYAELERRLAELHPYEVPEIIRLPLDAGYPPYLQWLDTQLDREQ